MGIGVVFEAIVSTGVLCKLPWHGQRCPIWLECKAEWQWSLCGGFAWAILTAVSAWYQLGSLIEEEVSGLTSKQSPLHSVHGDLMQTHRRGYSALPVSNP